MASVEPAYRELTGIVKPSYHTGKLAISTWSRWPPVSDVPLLTVPRTRTDLARRVFSVAAATTWNSQQLSNIRACRTVSTFQRHLKTYLFSLNMRPPAPLHPRTSGRYTNNVLLCGMAALATDSCLLLHTEYRGRSICLRLFLTFMSRTKTAEPIEMSFEGLTQVGSRNYVLGGSADPQREREMLGIVGSIEKQKHWEPLQWCTQKRLNRSRCRFGDWLTWAKGSMY